MENLQTITLTTAPGSSFVVSATLRYVTPVIIMLEGKQYDMVRSGSLFFPITPLAGRRQVNYYAPFGELRFAADTNFPPGAKVFVLYKIP